MDIKLFDYNLPDEKIAKFPPEVRGQSKLLVLHRDTGKIEHKGYQDMVEYFQKGDVLVLNNTKVEKQRVKFYVKGTKKPIELLFLYPLSSNRLVWSVLVGNAKALKKSKLLHDSNNEFEIGVVYNEKSDFYNAKFLKGLPEDLFNKLGETPIPPYLHRKETPEDKIRYNTVFAKEKGSVAAPTASLNVTDELLKKIRQKGVEVVEVQLDISWGTFAPVKTDKLEEHKIHEEYYYLSEEAAEKINQSIAKDGKVWALGTTVSRVLETCATKDKTIQTGQGWTNIFIFPGYEWKIVDHLVTNFHVPKSTLMALVSSFVGRELIMKAYQSALDNDYKFLSYGDSMLIL